MDFFLVSPHRPYKRPFGDFAQLYYVPASKVYIFYKMFSQRHGRKENDVRYYFQSCRFYCRRCLALCRIVNIVYLQCRYNLLYIIFSHLIRVFSPGIECKKIYTHRTWYYFIYFEVYTYSKVRA